MHGLASLAWRSTIRAGLAALAEDAPAATQLYRQALGAWRELGLPWDVPMTIIDKAQLLGPDHPDVRAVAPEARAILEGLGARAYVARLEAALARTGAHALHPAPPTQPHRRRRQPDRRSRPWMTLASTRWPLRVRFDECGADGRLRSGGYLRVMQELAWRHGELLGFGRDWYREHRVAWLVPFADLRIAGAARSGDTLRLTTRVTGWRRVWARRESTASVGGAEVARATIDWVLVDGSGRPARVPQVVLEQLADGLPTFQPGRLRLPPTPDDATTWRWAVSIRDLDPMRHVNNATTSMSWTRRSRRGATGSPARRRRCATRWSTAPGPPRPGGVGRTMDGRRRHRRAFVDPAATRCSELVPRWAEVALAPSRRLAPAAPCEGRDTGRGPPSRPPAWHGPVGRAHRQAGGPKVRSKASTS
ncbi:MAG: thioesterase [Chloroflexota bacterium]